MGVRCRWVQLAAVLCLLMLLAHPLSGDAKSRRGKKRSRKFRADDGEQVGAAASRAEALRKLDALMEDDSMPADQTPGEQISESGAKIDKVVSEGGEEDGKKSLDSVAENANKVGELSSNSGEAVPAASVNKLEQEILQAEKNAGDILPNGPCRRMIKTYCDDVTPGNRSLEKCLTAQLKAFEADKDTKLPKFAKKCRKAVRKFKIEVYKNVLIDKEMMVACKEEIASLCDDDFLYPEPGNVLSCLREAKEEGKLGSACVAKVFEAQLEAAQEIAFDPVLNETCSKDMERLCKDVEPGEGRIQECLRNQRTKLHWDCQAELFRQEVESAGDIRLNVRLFRACLEDKRRFCPDVEPGDARVKDCLEDHLKEPDFSPTCKEEFQDMMTRRATDFRLDFSLSKYCKLDISELCYPDAEDTSDVANRDAKVIECLQDYLPELKDPRCRQQVHKLTVRAADSIQYDRPLAEACSNDVKEYCSSVPDGNAQVFMCLQENRNKLNGSCKDALFEKEVRFSASIDFKLPLRKACAEDLEKLCKESTDAIRCLQDHVSDADMQDSCKEAVKKDEQRSAEDYRLNYRLSRECFHDVQRLCSKACELNSDAPAVDGDGAASETCGGDVMRCLQENVDKVKSGSCKEEVFYFTKREVKDLSLDIPLKTACREDLSSFCLSEEDHSRALLCLRKHRDELAPACKEEELRFSEMEASDIRLTPSLMNACGLELQQFCRDVPPSAGQAFRCLQLNMDKQVGVSIACKAEVELQTLRQSSYYRMDASLKQQCDYDVSRLCQGVDAEKEGHALVLKCLVAHQKDITAACHTELAYVVRMALWMYHRAADLTQPCDAAVDSACSNRSIASGPIVGVYGQCLLEQTPEALGGECGQLVEVIRSNAGHAGGVIDNSLLQDALNKIAMLEASANQPAVGMGAHGVVLTGWVAFALVLTLATVVVGSGIIVYKRFFDKTRPYTVIVKAGDV